MISMLIYLHKKRELAALCKLGNEIVCKISDEDWNFISHSDKEIVFEFLKSNPIIDISCVEIKDEQGVTVAEQLRKSNENMYIILVTEQGVSPIVYIKPTIMAASLLIRPLNVNMVKRVFTEVIREYLRKFKSNDNSSFVIDNRDGRQLIPYSKIMYFESREKRIYVNTGNKEFSFYDTLDNLQRNLPKTFLRCHRSFIVSRSYIKSIFISQNIITLENNIIVPLSRSYKNVFKELK